MSSIWTDFSLPPYPVLNGDTKTDVLIIGGGMAGILCAHALKEAGVHCIVAEADRIGAGVTARTGWDPNPEDNFYLVSFDVDAIDRMEKDAEKDGIMTAAVGICYNF